MADCGVLDKRLGATSESVMALYALARLLKSRDLGPAQLLPALEANRSDALKLGERLRELFAALRSAVAGKPHLEGALRALEPFATEVAAAVAEAFSPEVGARLGARERLTLERQAEQLGADLQGIRAQLELICAALELRPADLVLASVVAGRAGQPPAFTSTEARVRLDLGDDRGFAGDPRVIWPLFESALRRLAGRAGQFLLQARANGSGLRVTIRPFGPEDALPPAERELRVVLGASIRVEAEVVEAVARHLGIGYEVAPDEPAVTISLG